MTGSDEEPIKNSGFRENAENLRFRIFSSFRENAENRELFATDATGIFRQSPLKDTGACEQDGTESRFFGNPKRPEALLR